MEIQIKRVLTRTKNVMREHIKKCDICGCKRFRFEYDRYMEDTILVNCRYCRNRLYIGPEMI